MAAMDASLELKHHEVRDWLKGIYGDERIPPYEVNAATIEVMHELMRRNQDRDRESALLIEQNSKFGEEYASEASRLDGILGCLGLSHSALSQSGIVSMRALSSLALTLDLQTTSLPGYVAALSELTCSLADVRAKNEEEEVKIERTRQKMADEITRLSDLRRSVGEVASQTEKNRGVLDKRLRELPFYRGKAQEYTNLIAELKGGYSGCGYDESISHATLAARATVVAKLQADNASKSAALSSYNSLPPDHALAQIKIEEARKQLQQLDAALAKGIDLINA